MNNPKIMIVDDEEPVRQSYHSILAPKKKEQQLDQMADALFAANDQEDDPFDLMLVDEDNPKELSTSSPENLQIDDFNYDLIMFDQGKPAVQEIKNSLSEGKHFSLIFLDMRMPPGINGLETAKQIRELDQYVEIVIMTAYSDYSFEEIAEKIGSSERLLYFHKPFLPEQIQNLASTLTQKWQLEFASRQ
ncbi:MAG: response regulator [Proteobacteria bacterium]|nr:response regulator [Pseudomonadota bacterium]